MYHKYKLQCCYELMCEILYSATQSKPIDYQQLLHQCSILGYDTSLVYEGV